MGHKISGWRLLQGGGGRAWFGASLGADGFRVVESCGLGCS